ncbi:MAG: 1-deoxy-D-xylulose-5-phosphate reductoisomerase [Bacteroidota bacterium]
MNNKKTICLLGSTGSIGTQALQVVDEHPGRFEVDLLAAGSNVDLLARQALKYKPRVVILGNREGLPELSHLLHNTGMKVTSGEELEQEIRLSKAEIVLTAMVGFAGLLPTIAAIESGKNIALANKETLVVAGSLITKLAQEKGVQIIPVDSEHSAIYQCLVGEGGQVVEKIMLTASGGPFRGKDQAFLSTVTPQMALKHPNWVMGAKITIDSASLMNKGLEVIEAYWLFGVSASRIEVLVHPQSIIHSMVQFGDGSIKAQLGLPDMKLPIHYALHYPERMTNAFPRFDFLRYPTLSFESPDIKTFRNLALAFEALERGGNMPCVLNAANEIAVAKFLEGKIGFTEMSNLIERCMENIPYLAEPSLDALLETDRETRKLAGQIKH